MVIIKILNYVSIFISNTFSVGPCALDYSCTKSNDQFWTDPPADELVQRHRISSGYHTSPTCRTPINVRYILFIGIYNYI